MIVNHAFRSVTVFIVQVTVLIHAERLEPYSERFLFVKIVHNLQPLREEEALGTDDESLISLLV